MPSVDLTHQSFAVKILKGHLAKKRISHAYLFTGETKDGGEALALAYAAGLNCEEGSAFENCGCVSCRKVSAQNHPDIIWVSKDREAKSIKIAEIRESIQASNFKPYEGRYKVFLVWGAERLTTDAANALLKTLEEPPASVVFILLTNSKSNLLETIQSRCFEVRLRSDMKLQVAGQGLANLNHLGKPDFLEEFHGSGREKLKTLLEEMTIQIYTEVGKSVNVSPKETASWLRALEYVLESKQALDANVNQKLLLTRLAMHLRNTRLDRA